MTIESIVPDWPAPTCVRALMTTRGGGASIGPYAGFNVGDHVGDDPAVVAAHRRALSEMTGVQPRWLKQVHGTQVIRAERETDGVIADASISRSEGIACAVMTADCLPVLFSDQGGTVVAAAHAGWRGLCDGVLESTLAAMGVPGEQVMAWLGVAIGPSAFEVGDEVREAFVARQRASAAAFHAGSTPGKWWADLYAIARVMLGAAGVQEIYGGGLCTYGDAERFYSYRRDGVTGRMVSMIWLTSQGRG